MPSGIYVRHNKLDDELLFDKPYGRLIVRSLAERKGGHQYVWCLCDCGNVIKTTFSKLKNEHTTSCGCFQKEKAKENFKKASLANCGPKGQSHMKQIFLRYKKQAEKRNLVFELHIEDFIDITQCNCHYCGATPSSFAPKKDLNGAYIGNGIDRKNNLEGYTKENSLPCCKHCNYAKRDRTYEEFIAWLRQANKYTENLQISL